MGTRPNTNGLVTSSRSRRNKSDLIDLSSESSDRSSSNILDLFDPLNRLEEGKRDDRLQRSARPAHEPIELRPSIRVRRDRATSVTCIKPKSRFLDYECEPARPPFRDAEQIYITSDGTLKSASRTSSNPPSITVSCDGRQPIVSSSTDREVVVYTIDKLSLKPSRSSNDLVSSTKQFDLRSTFANNNLCPNNDLDSKLRLARKAQRSNQDIITLTGKLKSFRAKFKHSDASTNSGIVYSPTLYSSKVYNMSVKLIIASPMASEPVSFTCNVSTTVEHLISHAVCSMFESLREDDNMDNYVLKVAGKDEYFDSKQCLADYALVTHCWKFDLDVKLTLIRRVDMKRPFLRTSQDDFQCKSRLSPDDLMSRNSILKYSDLNYEALEITIETFEREAKRLYHDVSSRSTKLQTQSLLQTTKAICSMMMNCETSQLTEAKDNLRQLCNSYKDEGDQLVDEDRYKMIEVIQHAIKRLVANMRRLLKLTSTSLPVDYEVIDESSSLNAQKRSFVETPISLVREQVSIRIHLISQLKPDWLTKYQEFHLMVSVAHGERKLCDEVPTSIINADKGFFQRLLFDEDVIIPLLYSSLPRESRFIISLVGTAVQQAPNGNPASSFGDEPQQIRRSNSSSSICSTVPMYSSSPKTGAGAKITLEPVQIRLAKSIIYIFDQENNIHQGDKLVYMHAISEDPDENVYVESIANRNDSILVVELRCFPPEKKIYFPDSKASDSTDVIDLKSYESINPGVKFVLEPIIHEKRSHEPLMDDERALLWENRHYLTSIPEALPKVLLSAPSWSAKNLSHIYSLLEKWKPMGAVDALQLLLPLYPDVQVRRLAIGWISRQNDDELCDYLPQLLQAFRYERTIDCPLLWLLIERALKNVRIANLLFWQLKLNTHDKLIEDRSETLINCLLYACGKAFWEATDKQQSLLGKLAIVSADIKKVRDNKRTSHLHRALEHVQDFLMEKKPTMPWTLSLEVCDLDLRSCSYFPSNTLPLKLAFRSCEKSCGEQIKFHTYDTIFKMGDDLRQDMLAIQIIRIMEKLWLREGLDLRMVTFDCIATGQREGLVEVVQNAETLRKIHQNTSFLTGSFNPKAIDNYIRHWNTSELEYKTALDNFLHSCAGYSVATYILGICDRHNDNIMVTTSGHLFHIDFGKFLGDSQMLGSIKRDRTPFVLTADMAYVINGGDRPSKKFQTFIELCSVAFNIIRRYRNLFLNLFSLMSSAKINGLDGESVKYIDKMLMPNLSETEAMAKFTRLIDECLNSRTAQMNFFIHNLAQLRFSTESAKQSLLSFVPKTFTMQTDGKLESLELVKLYKIYEPEKQYYYVVRVKRQGQPDRTEITRTFREFSELQMKLACMFPSINIHDINKSTNSFLMDLMGRNNTREIAERRFNELRIFLKRLLHLPAEISQCDLIYTFCHPILRDQAATSGENSLLNDSSSSSMFIPQEYTDAQRIELYRGSTGQVKLKLSYKNSSLMILIMHAKNLPKAHGELDPDYYAKTYLLPDPHKQSKRKTRVVRRNCNPSFMELIVYHNLDLETLKHLTLQVSIWHFEIVQNKACVGSAYILLNELDLTKETTSWYPLKAY